LAGGLFLDKWKIFQIGYVMTVMMLLLFSSQVIADSEPNDVKEEAEEIGLGQEISGTLNQLSDEYDYYNITLLENSDIVLSLNGPDDADFDLSLLDNEGTKIGGNVLDPDSNEMVVYNPTYSGNYFIEIWAYEGNGAYNLNVDYPKTAPESSYSLMDAANNGYIDIEISGVYDGSLEEFDLNNGRNVFYGQCNIISIENVVANDLDIIIPAGQKLIATDEEVEDKVITMSQTINIRSLAQKDTKLFAMSINMYKDVPLRYTTYEVGPMATGDLLKIAEDIDENNYQSTSGQVAVWMVSDNAQSSYLKQLGASQSMITSGKDMLIKAGIDPPLDDSEDDSGFDFGNILNWICPAIIVIVIILAILGAIGKRSEKKAALPPQGPRIIGGTSSQKPPTPSAQEQLSNVQSPERTSQIPQTNKPPSDQPPPPPPPPPDPEKVEPVPYPPPKKDMKSK
jgi:hypothetical protein